jgi:hypothetical protein
MTCRLAISWHQCPRTAETARGGRPPGRKPAGSLQAVSQHDRVGLFPPGGELQKLNGQGLVCHRAQVQRGPQPQLLAPDPSLSGRVGYSTQPFVRTLEHFAIWSSTGSQDGEPSGEEPPGVWGSLNGHLPWETPLREPSRLVQTGSGPTSHRGGHWFDPSIAHVSAGQSHILIS